MIAQCALIGLMDVRDYTDDTIRHYFNHLIVNQHYLGAVNQIFTQDRKVATLCKLKSVYSDQFGTILKEYRTYSKELCEWRDRFHLSQKKDVAIPLVNYHMMLVRASACAQVIRTVLDDVEASSAALASSEWRVFPEILQSIGYLTGTISNMEFAAGEFYDLQQILGKMVLKVRNKENKNVATIDAYVNSIQRERIVTKTEIEYQDRLIPIGLKESLYFFFRKRFKFLFRK